MTQFEFGPFVLDHDARALRLKGREMALQPRVFDLLVYLVTHRARVVSKDELLDNVWPGVIVTDGSLQRAISLLRATLREGGMDDAIKSFPRIGYRLSCRDGASDDIRAFAGRLDRGAARGRRTALAGCRDAVCGGRQSHGFKPARSQRLGAGAAMPRQAVGRDPAPDPRHQRGDRGRRQGCGRAQRHFARRDSSGAQRGRRRQGAGCRAPTISSPGARTHP